MRSAPFFGPAPHINFHEKSAPEANSKAMSPPKIPPDCLQVPFKRTGCRSRGPLPPGPACRGGHRSGGRRRKTRKARKAASRGRRTASGRRPAGGRRQRGRTGVKIKTFGPLLLGSSPEIDPGTPLDRPGAPRTSICTKNQPRGPILRLFRGFWVDEEILYFGVGPR